MATTDTKFVGIQISPISFVDEGVGPLLDLLQGRFGINVLLIGSDSRPGTGCRQRTPDRAFIWRQPGR